MCRTGTKYTKTLHAVYILHIYMLQKYYNIYNYLVPASNGERNLVYYFSCTAKAYLIYLLQKEVNRVLIKSMQNA